MHAFVGWCPQCGRQHGFSVSGKLKYAGLLTAVAAGVGFKRSDAFFVGAIASLILGDWIERKIASRCPECRVPLQILDALVP